MKYKLTMIALILILAVIMAGCFNATYSAEYTCDDFAEHSHITHDFSSSASSAHNEIQITLCSNPTTGFKWDEVKISDPAELKLVSREFFAPGTPENPAAPGTAGIEVFTFKVLGQGQSTALVEYSQPWEGGQKAVWTYTMTVNTN